MNFHITRDEVPNGFGPLSSDVTPDNQENITR
jgi:hypothetical protein